MRLAFLTLGLAGASLPGGTPAPLEFEFAACVTGGNRMTGPGLDAPGGTASAISLTWLERRPLPARGWFGSGGVQAESFSFAGGQAWPQRLQDYALPLSLEYYEGAENVAALTIRPGWYFGRRPAAGAWDVPVDLAGGLPLSREVSVVLGMSDGRFYHHALPIVGLVWTPGPRVRLELAYPEPAVVVTFGPDTAVRLGGELSGAGFLSDAKPGPTPVEYTSYRAGIEWSKKSKPGLNLAVGAGAEIERDFDFFRQGRKLHGRGSSYFKISAAYSR